MIPFRRKYWQRVTDASVTPNGKLFDTSRATYDPKRMALFHDILFSSGFE